VSHLVLQDITRMQQRMMQDIQQVKAQQTLLDERVTALQEEFRDAKTRGGFRGVQ
jgi:hypothetical protein